MRCKLAIGGVALLALAACSSTASTKVTTTPLPAWPVSAAAGSPSSLVGMWGVAAKGEPATTVLRMSGNDLDVVRECGVLRGGWVAVAGGQFSAVSLGWDMTCRHADGLPRWLDQARGFREKGTGRELLDADGSVLARLLPNGKPYLSPGLQASEAAVPTLTPAIRQSLDFVPPALPAGQLAATRTNLIGTWSPAQQVEARTPPSLTFSSDGTWEATDGCNRFGGPWLLGANGHLLTQSLPTAGVGCLGLPVDEWVFHATQAAVTGEELTLFDHNATVIARFTR